MKKGDRITARKVGQKQPKEHRFKPKADVSEQLDTLNAKLRYQPKSATAMRRRMEAGIEAKAQERRRNEAPASKMLGGAVTKPPR